MKLRITLFLSVFFIFGSSLFAQKERLLFENPELNKTITVENKDLLNLQFNGYLGQTTELKSYVSEVKDSSIVFKSADGICFKNKTYEVKYADITGFRKLSKFQPYIKPAINISVTVGSYFIFDASNKFSDTEVILYTTVVGVATTYIVNLIFKENIEFKIADGWNLRVAAYATE